MTFHLLKIIQRLTIFSLLANLLKSVAGRIRVKIHAYRVVARGDLSLDAVVSYINSLSLADRLRTVAGSDIRLEIANKAGNTWSLDFAGIRPEGPGRASPTTPIADFDLADDEGFGEETGAVYNIDTGFMALQFNARGPRNGRIQGYLFRFARAIGGLAEDAPNDDDYGFTLLPVIRNDSVDRLNNAAIIKKFRASVYVPGLLHVEQARRRSLSSVLDNPVVGGAASVNLQISAGRKKRAGLNLEAIRTFSQELLGLGGDVEVLEAVIRETEDGPNEPIDLLEARLEVDVRVARAGRRYARNDRWGALRTALANWSHNGKLA